MKQKPDETLDQWVRQTLSHLPDTPPPGSSFDPEQLWSQLRPELQSVPDRRRIGLAWWLVAACLSGLAVGWFWLYQSADDGKAVAADGGKRKAPLIVPSESNPVEEIALIKPDFSKKRRAISAVQGVGRKQETSREESTSLVIETPEESPEISELPTVVEMPPVVEKLPELPKPNVASVAPKRRFRVVHENELRAEEEARPKLYRTEHFVRIGTGRSEEAVSVQEDHQPALIMSLTNKPNH